MHKHNFVICYDIANIKRLAKIAKELEKDAFRIQKSIFFYPKATSSEIKDLVNRLLELIDEEEDDVRIYKVDVKNSIFLASGIDLKKFQVLL